MLVASASGHEALSIFLLDKGANPRFVVTSLGIEEMEALGPAGTSHVDE